VDGRYNPRKYHLARCPTCGFAFIADPWLDFKSIYDDRYYAGQGADPLVDYYFELEYPERTIRRYEWEGIATVVADLVGNLDTQRWLDYGCGNGGLVRYLRAHRTVEAFGFEEGSIAVKASRLGIPLLDASDLAKLGASFDVVTAIEVLEHTLDPVNELRNMRRLLRPGGLLFLTTGNARPYIGRLSRWSYVVPELHISFFEPRTLECALEKSGLRPERRPLGPGFDEILKFKVLKNLRIHKRSVLTDALPERLIAAIADRRVHLSEHPIGWAT
jgi:SAM-dependent methyltransferase